MIELEMDFTFNNLSADIKIWHYKLKKFRKITALFDTGANISAIDTDTFKEFGYKLSEARNAFVTTASHRNFAVKRTVIHDLMLGDLEIGPFSADVIEFPMVSCQMILGLNIIRFSVDEVMSNTEWVLERLKDYIDKINDAGIEQFVGALCKH